MFNLIAALKGHRNFQFVFQLNCVSCSKLYYAQRKLVLTENMRCTLFLRNWWYDKQTRQCADKRGRMIGKAAPLGRQNEKTEGM